MKCLLFANTDWYLYNFRRSLAAGLRDAGHEVLLVSPAGPYGEKLRELGFRWLPAPMDRKSVNPLQEAGLMVWLWRLARRERPDVIHGFTIKCAVYGALLSRLTGAASVNAVAGLGYVYISNSFKARILRGVLRVLMRFAFGGRRARVVLQNNDDITFFTEAALVRPENIALIKGSGVDCSRFLPVAAHSRSDARPVVVLAARILWDKGVGEFVEAAHLLKTEGSDARFMLAGSPDPGNPASVPEEQMKAWQADGLVECPGHIDDMPGLYSKAAIVVLPSYREGLPKSLIEAAACALPLVTTDVPGCREVVQDGIDGLLVPVRDSEALATAIRRLLVDPALARRLGVAARAKALAEFDEKIVIAKTIAVYRQVAALR